MAKSKIDKAIELVQRFDGRLNSRQIKDKIIAQCKMSSEGGSTYYYLARERLGLPRIRD